MFCGIKLDIHYHTLQHFPKAKNKSSLSLYQSPQSEKVTVTFSFLKKVQAIPG